MTKDYDLQILDMINASQRVYKAQPLLLGGASGAHGGIGGPPGGFVGKLPQSRVCYDTTEYATLVTASGGTLVDNLNHIRYRLGSLETASGSGGHIIVFSGIDLPQEDKLEFVGPGVTVVDSPGTSSTIVTISGGGVEEALIDGTPYSRQDAAWVSSPTGIAEAPIDTSPYSRQDAGWVAAGTVINTGPSTQDNFASFSDGTGNSIGDSYVPLTAIPDGGDIGQVLTKFNGSDFNTYWADIVAGAFADAPIDGTPYGRQDAGWISTLPEAPIDGTPYARQDSTWVSVSGGGGDVEEAPIDGVIYGRRNTAWEASVEEAPDDGSTYGRNSIGWIEVSASGIGIPEAPADGKQYARKDNTWVEVTGGEYVTELLTGTIDDGNVYFYASKVYKPGSTVVSVNGIQQLKDTDYTEDVVFTDRIIFSEAPSAVGFFDILQITYLPA